MDWLECAGTALNLLGVWLMTRRSVWTWPVGLGGVVLFAALFHRARLYSDFLEQLFYLAAILWGWRLWVKKGARDERAEGELPVRRASRSALAVSAAVISAGGLALGAAMSRVHLWWPRAFPQPAVFPYLDAFTTVAGFVAQTLMTWKLIENWHIWIAVNALSVGIYWAQDLRVVSWLYLVFLLLAAKGLRDWSRPKA